MSDLLGAVFIIAIGSCILGPFNRALQTLRVKCVRGVHKTPLRPVDLPVEPTKSTRRKRHG